MRLGDLVAVMRQHWPFPAGRTAVIEGYRALGRQHAHVLADIALRNHLFADAPATTDIELAIAEGRRRAALEIVRLANIEPAALMALLETKPVERGERR